MKYFNKSNLMKLRNLSGRYKLRDLYYKIQEKLSAPYRDYNEHVSEYLPTQEELETQTRLQAEFLRRPLVSIIVPTYETEELFLRQLIDSVMAQTYPNWQLCLADGSQTNKVESVIAQFYPEESRISYQRLQKNGGISENTNQGFAMAGGEYIALLDHDDLLVSSALYEMVKKINETGADFLYSDEDKVSSDLSQYMEPHFKLDFNGELLLGNNYICHFLMVSKELLAEVGGLDSQYDGAQDFDFVLRCSEKAKGIAHVAKVLYHWRVHQGSTAGNTDSKLYAYEAGKRAVEAHLRRKGWKGSVQMTEDLGFYRTGYEIPEGTSVGILTWGQASSHYQEVYRAIVKELQEAKAEIVWEGHTRNVEEELPTLLGKQHQEKQIDYLVILNKGIKKVQTGSVKRILGSCAREDVWQVGSKTIAKGKVLQCGYWEENGELVPRFVNLSQRFKGYFRRAYLPAEVDAVSKDLTVIKTYVQEGRIVIEPFSQLLF